MSHHILSSTTLYLFFRNNKYIILIQYGFQICVTFVEKRHILKMYLFYSITSNKPPAENVLSRVLVRVTGFEPAKSLAPKASAIPNFATPGYSVFTVVVNYVVKPLFTGTFAGRGNGFLLRAVRLLRGRRLTDLRRCYTLPNVAPYQLGYTRIHSPHIINPFCHFGKRRGWNFPRGVVQCPYTRSHA